MPIHVSGSHDVMPVGRYWPKFQPGFKRHPVEISFGPPIRPQGEEHRSEVMERVREHLEHVLRVGRTFVTGASGFIGGALATRLHERGDDLVGLARSDTSAQKVAARGLTVVRGDVLDEDSLAARDGGLRPRLPLRRAQLALPA